MSVYRIYTEVADLSEGTLSPDHALDITEWILRNRPTLGQRLERLLWGRSTDETRARGHAMTRYHPKHRRPTRTDRDTISVFSWGEEGDPDYSATEYTAAVNTLADVRLQTAGGRDSQIWDMEVQA